MSGRFLRHRQFGHVAVNSSAGGKDDPLHPMLPAALQDLQRPQHVDPGVDVRVFQRRPYDGLRRQMQRRVKLFPREQTQQLAVQYAEPDKAGLRVDIVQRAGRQVIHHNHLMALSQQLVDDMRTDETGPAGYQYLHYFVSPSGRGFSLPRNDRPNTFTVK